MNFLFKDHDLVFIHLPKNAGTSIRAAFSGTEEGPIAGSIPQEWERFPSFAVVRNPFDRFLSAINMFRFGATNLNSSDYYNTPRFRDLTPAKALDILEDESVPFDRSVRSTSANLKHHLWPQTHPFNCLHLAKTQLRYENLEEELKVFAAEHGMAIQLSTMRSAKGSAPIYRPSDLSPSEIERILKLFKDDFDRLGYSTEVGDSLVNGDQAEFQHMGTAAHRAVHEEEVRDLWPAYFLRPEDLRESSAGSASSLPPSACNLEHFNEAVIPGPRGPLWAGRARNLIEHFRNLEPEFGEKKRISHLLACCIVALRRDPTSTDALSLFNRITSEYGQEVAADLNSRWLTSVCDTFVDVSENPLDRSLGLTGSLFANTIKLVETYIAAFQPPRPWPPKNRVSRAGTLYDDVLPFWIERGDAIDNLLTRVEKALTPDSSVAPFVEGLISRALENDTALGRISSFAGNKNPPLASKAKVAALKKIMATL